MCDDEHHLEQHDARCGQQPAGSLVSLIEGSRFGHDAPLGAGGTLQRAAPNRSLSVIDRQRSRGRQTPQPCGEPHRGALAWSRMRRTCRTSTRSAWPTAEPPAVAREHDDRVPGGRRLGYRYLEIDLHVTRDGRIVIFHDHDLERLTDGRGKVWEWRWEDLRGLDAGHNFDPEAGHPAAGQGRSHPAARRGPRGVSRQDVQSRPQTAGHRGWWWPARLPAWVPRSAC